MSSTSTYSNFYNFRDINNSIQTLSRDIKNIETQLVQDGSVVNKLTVDTCMNVTGETLITGPTTVDNASGLVLKSGLQVNNNTFSVSSLETKIFGLEPSIANNFTIKKISTGANHSAVLYNNGLCFMFGNNDNGQIGGSQNAFSPRLLNITSGSVISDVECGSYHTAFIMDGLLYTLGHNSYGQLGTGNTLDKNTPTYIPINNLDVITSLSCGGNHTMVAYKSTVDNKVRALAMGLNINGELGINSQDNKILVPTHVVSPTGSGELENVIQVACGFNHSAIITSGTSLKNLYTCGNNDAGQLGLGNNTNSNLPTISRTNEDIQDVKCGGATTFIQINTGAGASVLSVGLNDYGQLGRQTTPSTMSSTFGNVSIIDGYNSLTVGAYHGAIYSTSYIRLFGHNNYGQLTSTNNVNEIILNKANLTGAFNQYFADVTSIERRVTKVSCGGNHTLFVLNDKYVFACGLNSFGQLGCGNENTLKSGTPLIVVETDVNQNANVDVTGTATVDGILKVMGSLFVDKDGTHNLNIYDEVLYVKTKIDQLNNSVTNMMSDISSIKQQLTDLSGVIDTNVSNVSTITANISTNTANISTNTANISTNISTITDLSGVVDTNIANIATNTSTITDLSGVVDTKNTTFTTNIATNTSTITDLSGVVDTNIANIATNTSTITDLSGVVDTNIANIATNTSTITDLSGVVADLSGQVYSG
jgi:alpha-tubulin suppressor-like RCC1 family protein